jgi:spermidine synthase
MRSPRLLPALLLLFVGSGCAALIYEVVWFQLLELVIGSSAVSLGVLLGTFMGGMCLGSLLLPRVLSPRAHPLRVYAWLELGIGVIGLLVLFAMPLVGGLYTAWAGTGVVGMLMRGLAAAVCLLPPTILMGATLPAVARWVETSPQGVAWLGFFYGGNIAGAVMGSLLAGFYLLRVHDIAIATYVAVSLNAVVALAAFAIAAVAPYEAPAPPAPDAPVAPPVFGVVVPERWAVYVAIGLSGLTALASQVLWTRTLSLMLGATVYTFSLILAVFLFGLGIGSTVGSALAGNLERPRVAFAWVQLGLCAAMAWTSWVLTESLPYWPINPSISTDAWFQFQLDLTRCMYAVLPGAILWGASFPLALASVASKDEEPGRLVGGVYAANTLGAIVGSLGASLLLVIWIGSQRAQQLLIILAALSGLALMWRDKVSPVTFASAAVVASLFALTVNPVPGILVAFGRYAVFQQGQADIIYVGEGWNASVAVSERENGVRNYHNAGKVQASSEPQDMRLQRMLGHLTTLVPANPSKVLVIGCGAGVTAGAVSIDPKVESQTIAEIEPLVPRVVSTYFAEHNFDVVRNPKVRVHIDDARHFLQTTDEKFDAITSDPLDPWVKGAAMLYSTEFFDLVKVHLNPGGVVTLFVQLYESNTEAVKSEIGTFFEAFPNGMIFANTYNGQGYDLVLLGQIEETTINLDAIEEKLKRPEYAPVAQSLREIGMNSAVDLFATYAGRASDFAPWLADAEINRDRSLRLQYLAGRGLNLYKADVIYADMLNYSKEPDAIFTGSDELREDLLQKIRAAIGH